MKEKHCIKYREFEEKDYFSMEVDFECSCKNNTYISYYIDGEDPYNQNPKIDTLILLECENCKNLFLRRTTCDYFDMSGDKDKYSTSYSKITIKELSKLLIELEEKYKKPIFVKYENKGIFTNAKDWAKKYNLIQILEQIMKIKQILNYKITTQIGKGGMATVYKAKHINLDTEVAIKVLDPVLGTNDNIRQRFKQEAKIMASLNHQNITKVIDFEDTDNRLAIIMEYLNGQTLNDYIKQKGALSKKEAITIFSKILEGFSYAHKKGIVHRDIKPSNIFITNNGEVKIMDFGIAKIIEDDANVLTQTGTQMGTPVYMSPEQVNDSKHINHLSDIYSLGVCLWFILSGKPPYDAKTASTFSIYKKIDSEPLAELSNFELNAIVQKATAKDKEKRFKSCSDFIYALTNNIDNEKTFVTSKPISISVPKSASKPNSLIIPNKVESFSGFGYFIKAFKNYTNFKGRARRKEFWYFILFNFLASFIILFIDASVFRSPTLFPFYFLSSFIPYLSLAIRRIHDTGNSGWFILIPIYNLILFFTNSQKGENEYGQNPKTQQYENKS